MFSNLSTYVDLLFVVCYLIPASCCDDRG